MRKEPLCSYVWRKSLTYRKWEIARAIIDTLFFWEHEHCYRAFINHARSQWRKHVQCQAKTKRASQNQSRP